MIKNLIKKFTPEFLISGYHLKLAFLGAFLYGFPSRKLSVVGITGTSGKSTVVDLTKNKPKILRTGAVKIKNIL